MPVQLGSDTNGCFAKWGEQGHKYYYECGNALSRSRAKEKARLQGVAIGEFAEEKISFDFDNTLTKPAVQAIAKRLISEGAEVYVISARQDVNSMYELTDKLNIPRDHVFATGSNSAKVEKVKSLDISLHYDDNTDVISELGSIGKLVKLAESYTDYPQQATENAKIALRWAERNGWGSCGTAVGKARANQLAKGEPISRDTIARMASFERHRQNSQKELGDGCGRLMWLAWGGDAGIEWAQRKLKQIDKKELSVHERFAALIKFMKNDSTGTK